jgi:pimeloyl-ACP methyl ester carboxylesterase
VFTSQNYHDYPDKFMGNVDPLSFDRAVYKALKPGGVFLIVDHVAEAGSGMRDTDTLHRIDPAIVKQELSTLGVPVAYVLSEDDRGLGRPDAGAKFAARLGVEPIMVPGSHESLLTHPDEVAEALLKA